MEGPHPQLVATLERLLELTGADLRGALSRACDLVAAAVSADKVDAFVLDAGRESLVALGVSDQPLSHLQRSVGLDVLPLANRGRVVETFRSGNPFASGALDEDPEELVGIKDVLGVKSLIVVPLDVDRARRGALAVAWTRRHAFEQRDVSFVNSIARWVGIVAHRAELVEQIAHGAVEQGRQVMAEELMTVLAHDLRNHLTPIELRFTLMRMRAEHDGRSRDVQDCDSGTRAIQRLSQLVANILDVARLDRGVFQLELQPTDLAMLVRDSAALLSTGARRVDVDAPEELIVSADAERMRQVLENLMTNALQHSPRDTGARARVFARNASACVEIADQGSGIPRELLPHIFERFATGRPGHGLGLGLYMARRIARLHGGELEVSASGAMGSRFILTLPRN